MTSIPPVSLGINVKYDHCQGNNLEKEKAKHNPNPLLKKKKKKASWNVQAMQTTAQRAINIGSIYKYMV